MGKILCFIYDDMADFEITLACHFLSFAQKEIIPISYEGNMVKSRPGLMYVASVSVEEALELDEVEGIIIPGGWNDEQKPELTELIEKLFKEGKLVSAICAGPQFLARAGVLKERKFTTTLQPEDFTEKGETDIFPRENYVESSVVRDGNVITAKGNAFVDFAIELYDWFNKFENAKDKEDTAKYYKSL